MIFDNNWGGIVIMKNLMECTYVALLMMFNVISNAFYGTSILNVINESNINKIKSNTKRIATSDFR